MRKLPLSAKKAISVIVTIGMIISLFSCMSGLSAFAIDNTAAAKSAVSPVEVKSEVKEEVVEKAAPVNEVTYADESGVIQIQPYGGDTHANHCACGNQVSHAKIGSHEYASLDNWTGTSKIPTTAGNYYLTADITATSGASIKMAAATDVLNICLNGHKIYLATTGGTGVRALSINGAHKGILNICDCRGTGGFETNNTVASNGSFMLINGVSSGNTTSGFVNVFGGTYVCTASTGGAGAFAYTYKTGTGLINHTLSIYGGTFKGSTSGGVNYGLIGTPSGLKALNIYGGTFDGGVSKTAGGVLYLKECKTTNISGGIFRNTEAKTTGGIIHAIGTSGATTPEELNITGGTFDCGKAATNGGIIYTSNVALNIKGGTIQNGVATAGDGGNVYFTGDSSTKAQIALTGGTVKDGTASGNGGNFYIDPKKSDAYPNIQKGLVSGGTAAKGGSFYFTGIATTNMGKKDDGINNLTVDGGTASTQGAVIYYAGTSSLNMLSGTYYAGTFSSSSAKYGGVIYYAASASLKFTGAYLTRHDETPKINYGGLVYAASGIAVTMNESTGGYSVLRNGAATYGGNVYCNDGVDFTLNSGVVSNGTATYGGNLYLDIGSAATLAGGEISGGLASNGSTTGNGGNIYGKVANINVSGTTIKNASVVGHGGLIYIESGALTVTDGTFTGGTAAGNGGMVYAKKSADSETGFTINISGGTFGAEGEDNGAYANNGGMFFLYGSSVSTATISGGTFQYGYSESTGGIINAHTTPITITGNPIFKNGTAATSGGLISNGNTSPLTIEGGTFQDGVAVVNGGLIYAATELNISGGTFKHGTAVKGGNIYFNNVPGTISGNTVIEDGVAGDMTEYKGANGGGNVYLYGAEAKVTMTGGEIKNGTAYSTGGNLYVDTDTVFTQNGGTISGGKALTGAATDSSYYGGNVFLNGTFKMEKDENVAETPMVENGYSDGNNGGNFSVQNDKAVLTITHGIVRNGVSKLYGSIAYAYHAAEGAITIGGDAEIINDDTQTVPEGYVLGGLYIVVSEGFNKFLNVTGSAIIDHVIIYGVKASEGYGIKVTNYDGTINCLEVINSVTSRASISNFIGKDWDADYITSGNIVLMKDGEDKIYTSFYNGDLEGENQFYALLLTDEVILNKVTADEQEFDLYDIEGIKEDLYAYSDITANIKVAKGLVEKVSAMSNRVDMFTEMTKVKVKTCSGFGEDGGSVLYGFYSLLDYAGISNEDDKGYNYAVITIRIYKGTVTKSCDKGYKYVTYNNETFLSVDGFSENYDFDGEDIDAFLYYATVSLANANATAEKIDDTDVTYEIFTTIHFNDGKTFEGAHTSGMLIDLCPEELLEAE